MPSTQEPPLVVPTDGASFVEVLEFAATFNAYERWASEPHELDRLLEPIRREWSATQRIPLWVGVDALRALLFLEYRMDYMEGGGGMGQPRMRQICTRLREVVSDS